LLSWTVVGRLGCGIQCAALVWAKDVPAQARPARDPPV